MAKKRRAPAEEQAIEAPPVPAPEPPAVSAPEGYVIAPGCSMSCSGRIRGPGSAVASDELHNDPSVSREAFAVHLESGVIVKAE